MCHEPKVFEQSPGLYYEKGDQNIFPTPLLSGHALKGRKVILPRDVKGVVALIACQTDGRNGADLRAVCMEAGMFAIREERTTVTNEDFGQALQKFMADFERQPLRNTVGEMFA